MPDQPFCFVDVETTGTNAVNGRIIEIGVLKVKNNKLIKTFQTLLNPDDYVDPFIEKMTGITSAELQKAPRFSDIRDELFELLYDSVFVAHNVRFDYSFIRNEFRRHGVKFSAKHFCTVKMARHLYPGLGRYNLDSIITNFNIEMKNRHRAFDDAKVLWEFFKLSKSSIPEEKFNKTLELLLKKPSLPPNLTQADIDNIPESTGVYIMYGENDLPIYIGKSINIKDRVLSHFTNDYLSGTDMKIAQQIKRIEFEETAGELSALLLESTLIKKHQPILNRMLRQSRTMSVLVKITGTSGYNSVEIKTLESVDLAEIGNILGVFRSIKQAKDYLYQTAKEFRLCPRLMGLEKGKPRSACFYTQLGQCLGACKGAELNLKYNLRFDQGFFGKKIKPWIFEKPIIIKELGDRKEVHLVDKWCYLGSVKDESEDISDLSSNYQFDYDTYKILKKFILNPHNQKYIRQI